MRGRIALYGFNDYIRYAYGSDEVNRYSLGMAYKYLLRAIEEWWRGEYDDDTRGVLKENWNTVMRIATHDGGPPIILMHPGTDRPYTIITASFEDAMKKCRDALRSGAPLVYINGVGYYGGRLDKEKYNG
jgi:hypothetical protein